jgi:cytochrome c oxidase subunit 2
VRRITVSRLMVAGLLFGGVFLFSGCGLFSSPQNTFAPTGQVAEDQKNLFLLTMWPALVIMIGVEFGLLFILWRFRRKKGDPGLPAQTHGNNRLEIAWTIAPIILLAFFIAPTVGGVVDLGRTPKNSLEVDVTGQRFSWTFAYPDPKGGPPIQADPAKSEMHIPVGKTIALQIRSVDVNHSFWVPKLAGKTDAIPGRANHMWLKGTETGTFSGQCAEFCGTGHATMRFTVVVQEQADFDAWLQEQAAGATREQVEQPELAFQGD